MGASPARSALLFLIGGLLGGAAASFAMWNYVAPAASAARGETSPELAASIRTLTEELRRWRDATGPVTAAAPNATREVVPSTGPGAGAGTGASPDRLAATLDHLAQVVQSLAASSAGVRAGTNPPLRVAGRERAADAFAGFGERDNQELTRAYFAWTYQQVLDRFGVPDYTSSSGTGVTWTYNVQQKDFIESHTFRFVDGIVMGVDN